MNAAAIRKQAEEKYPHDGYGKSAVELARLLALREGYIKGRLDQAEADAQIAADALRDACYDLQAYADSGAPFGHPPVEELLLNRALRIENGKSDVRL